MTNRMTKIEAIKYGLRWKNAIIDRGDTENSEAVQFLNMAIEALEQEQIIKCEDCKHHGTSNCPMWGDDTTEDYMWCCDGERREDNE